MIVANQNRPTSPVQESNTNSEDEAQIQPNSRKKVQKKTVKPRRQVLVVPNESQSEIDKKSESQFESEAEKPVAKTEFTEGIFWRPRSNANAKLQGQNKTRSEKTSQEIIKVQFSKSQCNGKNKPSGGSRKSQSTESK